MKKALITIFSILLALILIVVIAFVVVINLTPAQLNLADLEINGKTISELGLADMKIIDIYKSIKSATGVEESDVVLNPYNSAIEETAADTSFEGSSLDNKDNYASIVTEKVTYSSQKLVEYKDTTLAYILNNVVQTYSGDDEAIKYLKDAKVTIKEMTISVEDGKGVIRLVSAMDIGEFKQDIEDTLGAAKNILKVPDTVYLVSVISFDVPTTGDNQGVLATSSQSICVNGDNDNPVTKAIVEVVMSSLGENETPESLNGKLGEALSSIIKNLGLVGTATVDADNVVTGGITYGMSGVRNNYIKVITYKE